MSLNEIFGSTARSNSFESATGKIGSSFEMVIAKAVWLRDALRPWGMASIVAGVAIAGIGASFAIQQGVSVALALMAAYCVVATCIACTVTLALLSQRAPKEVVARPAAAGPNIAAWRLVSELRVSDACRLWCDIEPGSPYSQEAIAWATAMLDAIRKGELPILPRPGGQRDQDERERTHPSWRTRVSREALKSWASSHGFCPAFLHN
jgi:hypothetical protein